MHQSGETLADIVASVKKVTDIVAEIAAASQEQAAGIDQVNRAVMQMDEMTQQKNAALVEQAAAASSMEEQAEMLNELMGTFRFTAWRRSVVVRVSPERQSRIRRCAHRLRMCRHRRRRVSSSAAARIVRGRDHRPRLPPPSPSHAKPRRSRSRGV